MRSNDELVVFQDNALRTLGKNQQPSVTILASTKNHSVALDRSDDAVVWVDRGADTRGANPTTKRTLGQSIVSPSGTVESKTLATYDAACEDESAPLAHDGHVAFGSPPRILRRSDGVKLDAKLEYPTRAGNAFESVVYLDSKWLITRGRDALMRRPLAKLPILP